MNVLLGTEIVVLSVDQARLLVALYGTRSPREWYKANRELAVLLGDLQDAVRRSDAEDARGSQSSAAAFSEF